MENYNVYLKQFDINIKTSWQEFHLERDLCDVTLACDDIQILAHKLIISSCSPMIGGDFEK